MRPSQRTLRFWCLQVTNSQQMYTERDMCVCVCVCIQRERESVCVCVRVCACIQSVRVCVPAPPVETVQIDNTEEMAVAGAKDTAEE